MVRVYHDKTMYLNVILKKWSRFKKVLVIDEVTKSGRLDELEVSFISISIKKKYGFAIGYTILSLEI